MKIISGRYKDFYDHLQGIYGVDEKLILDRRKGEAKPRGFQKETLVIGHNFLEFYVKDGVSYIGKEALLSISSEPRYRWGKNKNTIYIDDSLQEVHWTKIEYPELTPRQNNTGIAIYLEHRKEIGIEFPKLEALGVNKILSAHQIWLILSEYLSQELTKNEPSVPIGDDRVRIESHGFDFKNSFRNVK